MSCFQRLNQCMRSVFFSGCKYKGRPYKDTHNFDDECNTCICNNGAVICTQMVCESEKKKGLLCELNDLILKQQ